MSDTELFDAPPQATDVEPVVGAKELDPVSDLTSKILSPEEISGAIKLTEARLDNVAWHDFTECMYLLEPEYWGDSLEPPDEMPVYLKPYTIFTPYSVNFGLRLVYRQEWRPLGNQRGEIVKTIPLGPGQVEKVSTRIVRRTQVARRAESLKSVEMTTETSESTKDSSEVIREAAANFNWHMDTQASAEVAWGPLSASAGVQAGVGGGRESRSRETSAKLSEAMQKTASRIRNETKTVVSTESESRFETAMASEIRNPNDAIAITYVYSKLQRQYEVFTSLAEAHNVVFVALPMPKEIDHDWVKKHDWILAKVLLDDSFRDALNMISTEPALPADVTRYDGLIETEPKSMLYQALKGDLSGTDLSRESEIYRETLKAQREQKRQEAIREHKLKRLYQHIRDNIFHYMRAIWSHMDPEQRILQLQKALREQDKTIARRWKFEGVCGKLDPGTHDVEAVLDEIVSSEVSNYASTEPSSDETDLDTLLDEIRTKFNTARDAEIARVIEEIETGCTDAIARETDRLEKERTQALEQLPGTVRDTVLAEQVAYAELKTKVAKTRGDLADRFRGIQAHHNKWRPAWKGVKASSFTVSDDDFGSINRACKQLKVRVDNFLKTWWVLEWYGALRDDAKMLTMLRADIEAAWPDEDRLARMSQEGELSPEIQREVEHRLPAARDTCNAEYDKLISTARSDEESKKTADIEAAKATITEEFDSRRNNEMAWTRAKHEAERRNAYPFAGEFTPNLEFEDGGEIDLLNLINPAGPIAYYGNYAIYYMKPEVAAADIHNVLAIFKTPYLYYLAADQEPVLMDPYLKELTRKYGDIVPERSIRDEMVEYVPELRLRYALFETEQEEPQMFFKEEPPTLEGLFADGEMFRQFYPEYLFRKELTRRFPVDTNNLVLDIEVGTGTALEAFKKAHRGIDVQRAQEEKERLRLENIRLRNLITEGKLDARYWPDGQKFVAIGGNGGPRFGMGMKPGEGETQGEVIPIAEFPSEMQSPPSVGAEETPTIVYGRVEEGEAHSPLAGAEVQIIPDIRGDVSGRHPKPPVVAGGVTSANGLFWLSIQRGQYRIIASAKGYAPASARVDLHNGPQEVVLHVEGTTSAREYIGNDRTKEVHRPDCSWVSLISEDHRVQVRSLKEALRQGYDRCDHCLAS